MYSMPYTKLNRILIIVSEGGVWVFENFSSVYLVCHARLSRMFKKYDFKHLQLQGKPENGKAGLLTRFMFLFAASQMDC